MCILFQVVNLEGIIHKFMYTNGAEKNMPKIIDVAVSTIKEIAYSIDSFSCCNDFYIQNHSAYRPTPVNNITKAQLAQAVSKSATQIIDSTLLGV